MTIRKVRPGWSRRNRRVTLRWLLVLTALAGLAMLVAPDANSDVKAGVYPSVWLVNNE